MEELEAEIRRLRTENAKLLEQREVLKISGHLLRSAAERYAQSDLTTREIGQRLGVAYLLVGSVRWAGSTSKKVRIALELLQTRDERQLWASTYDRVIDDIFEVQSDIASQVVGKLGVALPEDERIRLRARPTANREAYTLYLKGRYFWNQRTRGGFDRAIEYFERAIAADSAYAAAHAGLAMVYSLQGLSGYLLPEEAKRRMQDSIHKLKDHIPGGAAVQSSWSGDRLNLRIGAMGPPRSTPNQCHPTPTLLRNVDPPPPGEDWARSLKA